MGRQNPRRRARFKNWRDACYKFLLEQDEPVDTQSLTQRVLTRSGTMWESGPSTREVAQVLKYDPRFEYAGEMTVVSVLGSKYKRASFRARRLKDEE